MASGGPPTGPQFVEHISKSLNYTLYDTLWVPSSARCVCLGMYPRGTGVIQIMQISHGKLDTLHSIEKPSAFKCGTFGATLLPQRHLATGAFDGKLQVWDADRLDSANTAPVFSVQAHDELINCIDGCGGLVGGQAPELATCSRDGKVRVWDVRQPGSPVAALEPADNEAKRDCWAVAFGNSQGSDRFVVAGYDNGDVKMMDLRMNTIHYEVNLKNGICGLQFDRKDILMNKLVATTLEGKVFVFNLRCLHPESGYAHLSQKAHESTVWCVRHLPQNRDVFMTTGGNGSLELHKYTNPSQISMKDGQGLSVGVMGQVNRVLCPRPVTTQPITSFDWSVDKEGLCVFGSLDQTVRVGILTRLNTL